MKTTSLLKFLLRWVGSVSLLALVAVAMPYAWMNAIHEWLGLGTLPADPIVGYLARSTSAFYALFGGLLWVVSFDLARFQPVTAYVSLATIAFGLLLAGVDSAEGLPGWWRVWEGPSVATLGVVFLWLNRHVTARGHARETVRADQP